MDTAADVPLPLLLEDAEALELEDPPLPAVLPHIDPIIAHFEFQRRIFDVMTAVDAFICRCGLAGSHRLAERRL